MGPRIALLTALLVLTAGAEPDPEHPVVVTRLGPVKGVRDTALGGRHFHAFLGIPYAKPPVGKHRFKEAVAAKPWRGTWSAGTPGPSCLQLGRGGDPEGGEDCLYLNVFAPPPSNTTTTPRHPVLVNVHGGGFMQGVGHLLGPRYLLDGDVVYVSFNYRLGVLGFFSTGDAVVPGNNGLKDQVLALQWVRDNIAAFGGDPGRVTLMGTSAGGVSVHLHYLSPLSAGLFHRGIAPSGSALQCWGRAEELPAKGRRVAALLGCPATPAKEMVDCLRGRPARALVSQVRHFSTWQTNPFSPWGPTVEPAGHPRAFISEEPVRLLAEGRVQPLPLLTGVDTHEGLYPTSIFLAQPEVLEELETNWARLAPLLLDFNSTVAPDRHGEVALEAKRFYLGEKPVSQDTVPQLIQMAGDRLFVVDGERAARMQANLGRAPVYFYQFAYRGRHSLSEFFSGVDTDWGASHGDETGYVLDAFYLRADETDADRAMIRLMVGMWTSFMQTGYPNPPGSVEWSPIQPQQREMAYLWLGNATNLEMRSSPDLGNRHFWDSLPIGEPQVGRGRLPSRDEL